MTTTQMYVPKRQFDTPESQIENPQNQTARSEAAAGASIYRRLDAGRRQPKLVKWAPAVALGILAVGGAVAYLTLGHPAHAPAPTQVAQAAPPAEAPLPAAAPATSAVAPAAAPLTPGLKVTHDTAPAPTRLASAAPRHAPRRARGHAPSASDQGVNTSAAVAASPPASPAPATLSATPPTIVAPPEPASAPSGPS